MPSGSSIPGEIALNARPRSPLADAPVPLQPGKRK